MNVSSFLFKKFKYVLMIKKKKIDSGLKKSDMFLYVKKIFYEEKI